MEIRNLVCISCPMGCLLKVEMDGDDVINVTGNTCKRGEIYGRKEVTAPTRIVTTTVPVIDGELAMVSVKTRSDIPKDKVHACVEALKNVTATAPIYMGQIIQENVADTGVDMVATRMVGVSEK